MNTHVIKKVKRERPSEGGTSPGGTAHVYIQKFRKDWLDMFNWLAGCEDDVKRAYCRACHKRLICKLSHLQRHEQTSKHLKFMEILVNEGEDALNEIHTINRQKHYKKDTSTADTTDYIEDEDDDEHNTEDRSATADFHFVQTENVSMDEYTPEELPTLKREPIIEEIIETRPQKKKLVLSCPLKVGSVGRHVCSQVAEMPSPNVQNQTLKLLTQIKKDTNNILESLRELKRNDAPATAPAPPTPPKAKNHIEYFFDSMSSSVNALTPKLIAEAKMRFSQLICELELRALTENEAENTGVTALVVSSAPTTQNAYIIHQGTPHS